MYFTHSYAVAGEDPADVTARTHYTCSFPSMVAHGNVFGCQFHPEKSSGRGLDILRNFVEIARGSRDGGDRGLDGCDRNDRGDDSGARVPSCAESHDESDVAAALGATAAGAERPLEVPRP